MQEYLVWYMAAGALLIMEAFSPGIFIFICFALGALLTGFLQQIWAFTMPWQLAIFLVFSTLCLIAIKPLLKSVIKMPNAEDTLYANQLIGKTAIVFRDIHPDEMGAVKLLDVDETWLAKSVDDVSIAQGAKVKVLSLESNHLIVELAG